jgi:sugar transferase (PEP-CTERM/EpsH1 system associated)
MRILFIVPYVPNLIRVRPYNLIRFLAGRGHQITLATLWSDPKEKEDVEKLRPYCQSIIALSLPLWQSLVNSLETLPGANPLQASFSWSPGLARDLQAALAKADGRAAFDVVHVEHLRGSRYGLMVKDLSALWKNERSNGHAIHVPPVVWDSVDCISHLFHQAAQHSQSLAGKWMTRFELPRTERFEGWLVGQFDRVLVTSRNDREALGKLAGDHSQAGITVLPNGVDSDYFTPGEAGRREKAALVISGKMSYHANVTMCLDFARSTMPLIWKQRPDVDLWLVGKNPPAELRALAQDPRITVTGTVPDLRPYLQRATLAVAPLTYGAGIQNKVLESMACATPVLASPQAVSALDAVPGRDVLVGQDHDEMARLALEVLGSPGLQREIGVAGRQYVESNHRWTNIAERLEEVYHGVIGT